MSTPTALLSATGVRKSFPIDGSNIEVLHGVDLHITEGEFVAVMGPSGSGKSTLLYAVSGMDPVDAGDVHLAGTELTTLDGDGLADARRELMGFVFQQPTLLKDLPLLDNIVLTSALDKVGTPAERRARAEELMTRAGIWELRDRMTSQVSGGQLQRAGICRALMRRPRIIFGDEPTGALNSTAAGEIMDLLSDLNAEGTTLLVVTHDVRVAARAHRVVFMVDGQVTDELLLDADDEETRVDLVTRRVRELRI
ncbi:ABC transporter ATP-binding protein [Tessaracoccus flavus]|uniref:ABC transporter ATP-binding protein n=1 Tax=Tessaracoccus flavus TaxID=1610493 RepID=A0A1Q2CGM0_9ACTN|nr:ABC transporter ATP-binding protein [Tessaracoccus flavus]AQP45254.1 ABC transporter ATP-binding protein [Tessaracoccus flavus]SDY51252.1 putative ABC transport system ATP-binding protein [Tessaracoccus flavus]